MGVAHGVHPSVHLDVHLPLRGRMGYDRHFQNKSVRLLCVFLKCLIRNGVVDVEVSLSEPVFFAHRSNHVRRSVPTPFYLSLFLA
jgi:hypothetical protein